MAEVVISESLVARLAGNIASALVQDLTRNIDFDDIPNKDWEIVAELSVKLARMIVDEVKRTTK